MDSVFDTELLDRRLRELKQCSKFEPDEYDLRYTATQLYETGVEATVKFVVRDGQMIFYGSTERNIINTKTTIS